MDDGVIPGIPLLITGLYQISGVRTLQSGWYTLYDDAGTTEFLVSVDEIAGVERGGGTGLSPLAATARMAGRRFCLCCVSHLGGIKLQRSNHVRFLVFNHFS